MKDFKDINNINELIQNLEVLKELGASNISLREITIMNAIIKQLPK